MRSLPRKAQLYLWLVYLAGAGSLLDAVFLSPERMLARRWELAIFVVVSALAYGKKIRLMRQKSDSDGGSMSLGFTITFAALLLLGPTGAVLAGFVGCLLSCLFPRRQPLHQMCFNVAITVAVAWAAGGLFLRLNGGTLHLRPLATFPAVAATSLAYFFANTYGVALVVALCSKQGALAVWRQSFMWTAPSYFAGACISTLALMLCGSHSGATLLFISPVAYLTYQSYSTYIGRAEEKQQHIESLAELYLSTIKSLALAIDAKDQYTHRHILRVQRYAVATARHMGLEGKELEGINTGALLHDIGKLGVPEYVLLKPGRLTDEEFAKIKKHPEIGAAILGPVEFPWPVLPVVKYHHEKWDGTGYPEGLKGEAIPLSARILAVADVYDALTSNRSYRNAWTHEKAIDVIIKDTLTHFDEDVVHAFLQIIDGVLVEMAAEAARERIDSPGDNVAVRSEAAVRDIQRASSELWALYEVAQTLSSSLGLQETLEILSRKLEAILPGTGCLFLIRTEGGQELVVRAAVGVNKEFLQSARTLNAASGSLQVAEHQQTFLGPYDPDDLLMVKSPTAQWEALQSALIVPIVHQGEVLGTINLYHPQRDAFGPHDQQLLETIAERSAMALYNGLLFDRTRSHALTDPLTGLYNVRYLTEYVEEQCRRDDGAGAPFALLCLDLDSFKPINDNFGHQKGDQVLRDLARIFRQVVGEGNVVARYGGDEFLIVLHGAEQDEAAAITARLYAAVEGYDPHLQHERLGSLYIGASVGFGCFPSDGRDCTSLMSVADSRMYADKLDRKLGALAGARRGHDDAAPDDPSLRLAA